MMFAGQEGNGARLVARVIMSVSLLCFSTNLTNFVDEGRKRRGTANIEHNFNSKIINKMKVKRQYLSDDCHIN